MAKGVKVYRRVHGEPLERIVARTHEAYTGTEHAAHELFSRAETILRSHHAYGGSKIEMDDSDFLTWKVVLTDSQTAHDDAFRATSGKDFVGTYTIEYGHRNNNRRYGAIGRWVEGPSPLRRALDDLGWGSDYGKAATGRGKRG